ncbi:MAG: hypothetical protein R3F17_16780 [Planctomycetota bacterium]
MGKYLKGDFKNKDVREEKEIKVGGNVGTFRSLWRKQLSRDPACS